jgi:hypothetical protein
MAMRRYSCSILIQGQDGGVICDRVTEIEAIDTLLSGNMIEIKHSANDEWVVSIRAQVPTRHHVRVTKADLDRLSEGGSAEELIRESFQFLLERESNTSILRSFDLPLIGHYFPEYEREIRLRLRQRAADSDN